jgi:hypothetical protein
MKESSETRPGATIAISLVNAIADDLDDIRDATAKEMSELRLELSDPEVRVDLWRTNASVSHDRRDDDATDLADDIVWYIQGKRTTWDGVRAVVTWPPVILLTAFVLGDTAVDIYFSWLHSHSLEYATFRLGALVLLLLGSLSLDAPRKCVLSASRDARMPF